jgi:phosphoribosylaminoimidazole carboxylase (NCAIR synthetase)
VLGPALQPTSVAKFATADPPTVLLGNFDVERQWSVGEPGLPTPTTDMATAVVASTDELVLLLGHRARWAVVKSQPDPGLIQNLERVGLTPPSVLVTDGNEPTNTVTEDALVSPVLLERLRGIAAGGGRLVPHGFSHVEAALCEATGLIPPIGSPAIAKTVNSKVFSRRLCHGGGIEQPPGWECENLSEVIALREAIRRRVDEGVTIAVKSAYGVSGKGIVTIGKINHFDRLTRMLTRQAERIGDDSLPVVIEEWQDKQTDLNYHFTIGADEDVRFDFVLEAVTESGTHRGHRLPARINDHHRDRMQECAETIGRVLAAEGYRGPVGVDAIVCTDGSLLPVIEINARNNMSTYLTRVREMIAEAGSVGLALQVDLRLSRALRFNDVTDALRGIVLGPSWRHGFLVTCFASVNAAARFSDGSRPFRGRLHGVAVAETMAEVERLENDVRTRLCALEDARD